MVFLSAKNQRAANTHTHTSAVPEHGPTLTGPTPSLELTASHEPKENKFYQTAIAIRMNSLKDIYFWFLDFFCQCCVFFSLRFLGIQNSDVFLYSETKKCSLEPETLRIFDG